MITATPEAQYFPEPTDELSYLMRKAVIAGSAAVGFDVEVFFFYQLKYYHPETGEQKPKPYAAGLIYYDKNDYLVTSRYYGEGDTIKDALANLVINIPHPDVSALGVGP